MNISNDTKVLELGQSKKRIYSKQPNNLICIPEPLERNLHHKKKERERTRGTCQCALMGCETLVILTVSGDAFYVSPGKICSDTQKK